MPTISMLPRQIADRAIAGYQRHVSPRKGYRCAHGVVNGDTTCSAAIRDIVAEKGVLRAGVPSLRQFASCYRASMLLALHPGEVSGVCCCGPIPIPFRF